MILGNGTLAEAFRENHVESKGLIWCAYDTPIRDDGTADSGSVIRRLSEVLDIAASTLVIICSQLPVGTCAELERCYPRHRFIVYPENVRAAYAVEDFKSQDRIVLGGRVRVDMERVASLLAAFTDEFIFTTPETAEMVKHALNGFLAMSIRYAQDIARIATAYGADPDVLADALLSDHRIGPYAYLRPSGDLGPHLTREVHNLIGLGGGDLIKALA